MKIILAIGGVGLLIILGALIAGWIMADYTIKEFKEEQEGR